MRRVFRDPIQKPQEDEKARKLRLMHRTLRREASKAGGNITKKSLGDMTAEDLLRICALNNIEVKFKCLKESEYYGRNRRRHR